MERKLQWELWKEIRYRFCQEYELSPISYSTWIEPLDLLKVEANKIYFGVPAGEIAASYIKSKYGSKLRNMICEETGIDYDIVFQWLETVKKDNSKYYISLRKTLTEKMWADIVEQIVMESNADKYRLWGKLKTLKLCVEAENITILFPKRWDKATCTAMKKKYHDLFRRMVFAKTGFEYQIRWERVLEEG